MAGLMGEREMTGVSSPRRVVATNVGRARKRVHYVVGDDIGGRYVHTACGKSMTQVAPYGGNALPLCTGCVVAKDAEG